MKGQWIGKITGDQVGQVILNIDDCGTHFHGVGFAIPDNKTLPSSVAVFDTEGKTSDFNVTASLLPINPTTGVSCTWGEIQHLYPGMMFSKFVVVMAHYENNDLSLNARTEFGVKIESKIARKAYSDRSEICGSKKTWEEYKNYVASLAEGEYLFRGQAEPWKLRTAFHRRGRYDLDRFLSQDIPKLHLKLTARTKHIFNLQIPSENGAFLNLAQHHGFPTPLLDWTFSPYAAAFFAFRNVPKMTTKSESVRIFIFNQKKWRPSQLIMLNTAWLHFSIMEFYAIENERAIPQQSVTTVTNIDDIEAYISQKEEERKCEYLKAIDIPWSERNKIIKELSYMGITAGSMFPGLDGVCEELREKLFDE